MKAFISYSHKDETLREELEEHLALLRRQGKIDAWTDRRIEPGDRWADEIGQALEEAEIILLLISPSFLASDFCYDEEMKRAMERHAEGSVRVVPIIVRPCNWHAAPFGKLQGLPKDAVPITTWPNRDTAWLNVVEGLCKVLDSSPRQENKKADLLPTWFRRVKADHETLLGDLQKQADFNLLDPVYVQLDLTAGLQSKMRAYSDEEAIKLDHGAHSLREYLDLDPGEHSWVTRRWIVKGDPGAGKTTLLRHLASKLAEEALEGGDRWIPVFESLPRLVRSGDWLLDKIDAKMKQLGKGDGFGAVLDDLGKKGRLLVLLDGLDEVPGDKSDAEAILCELSERWPESQIVVSSRPIGFRSPSFEFRELEIQSLTRERQREFLARWLGRFTGEPDWTKADEHLPHLSSAPSLRDLAGNPLYLTLMALLFENGEEPIALRTKLYDQIFDLLLKSKHRPPKQRREMPRIPATRAALRELAVSLTGEERTAASREELADRLFDLPCGEKLSRVGRWSERLTVFLDDLSERTSILGPHDGEDADWRFWHRTFREALAAEALAELDESELIERVEKISGDESRWAEPFALLAGRVKDADALVRKLINENKALGLRAVATAQGLSEEVIDEILGLSGELSATEPADPTEIFRRRDVWESRHQIYERLPELVGDAERTLLLIDRLRRREGLNRGELFLLDDAISRVIDRWPNESDRANRLRERLYDHLPKPEKSHFQMIETSKDGTVQLWREISAGGFLIGSMEGVGHDTERPQHRVEIERPFWMATTTVTNRQYAAFDPIRADMNKPAHPVVYVTWYEAMAFCAWLSQAFPGVRLPTEAEWEYACRAGTTTKYWSGDAKSDLDQVGWYDGNSGGTHAVGEKAANDFGLYDVHGNVWEWMLSEWFGDYSQWQKGRKVDPQSADLAELDPSVRRVVRGGSYWDSADGARSAYREHWNPRLGSGDRGFRVLRPSPPELDD